MSKLKPGTHVRVMEGSGLRSNQTGVIISRTEIQTGNRGIPLLPGHYKPVDWTREVAIRLDAGYVITMFKSHVEAI